MSSEAEELKLHLEQIGIDIRTSGNHQGMRAYIHHLQEEQMMTEQFLRDDGAIPQKEERKVSEEHFNLFDRAIVKNVDMSTPYEVEAVRLAGELSSLRAENSQFRILLDAAVQDKRHMEARLAAQAAILDRVPHIYPGSGKCEEGRRPEYCDACAWAALKGKQG